MADPFVGEIRMFGGNFAPIGWAFCNGQLLDIAQNDVLFALLGTTYGGDGMITFALPNLQGRLPVHQGNNQGTTYNMGEASGTEAVTLTSNQLPIHTHTLLGRAPAVNGAAIATHQSPVGNVLSAGSAKIYSATAPTTALNAASVTSSGANQPHSNLMPTLCVNFIISLFGIFPSRN
jgi:microcystin-dependent protein